MQKGQIVFRLFVPTYQDAPKAVQPRMSPLDDPAPSLLARVVFERLRFRATRPNMGREPKLLQDIAHFLIVIAFVEAQALGVRLRGRRAFGDEAVERSPDQFHVMPVGARHCQPNGHPVALGQQAALDPAFGAIGGIRAGFFPPQVVPWSWHHPCSASPTRCPGARQTGPRPLARVSRRRPQRPTPDTGHGPWIWHITRSDSGPPTGSRCGARKKWHRHSGDPVRADGHRQSGGYSLVRGAAVRARSTAHRKYGTPWSSGCWGCESVCVWLVVVVSSYPRVYQVIRIGSKSSTSSIRSFRSRAAQSFARSAAACC